MTHIKNETAEHWHALAVSYFRTRDGDSGGMGGVPYPVAFIWGRDVRLATVLRDNGTNAFALALREAASVQTRHERRPQPLRCENVAVAAYAPTDPVPRRLCTERVAAEYVASDRTKAAWRSGRPPCLPRQIGLLPLLERLRSR
jgi:hypothetical protein